LDNDAFVLQASRLYCLSSPQLGDVEAVEGTTVPPAPHLALAERLGPVDLGDRDGQDFELPVDFPDSFVAA
jgi:hypothetical protein